MKQAIDDRRAAPEELVRTVLFSDVVASTEVIDHRGDNAWLDIVDRHARAVCAIARHHHGEVISFLGDGFMIMFDDPADALQCAMRLQVASRVQDLVHIRIGLDHGEVFRYRDSWYVGRTIHVAARLADLGDGDEILVTNRCMDQARRRIPAPPSKPRRVKIRGLRDACLVHVLRGGDGP